MSKPKKDWKALNIRMSSDIYDTLTHVERILKKYLVKEGYKIEKKSSD